MWIWDRSLGMILCAVSKAAKNQLFELLKESFFIASTWNFTLAQLTVMTTMAIKLTLTLNSWVFCRLSVKRIAILIWNQQSIDNYQSTSIRFDTITQKTRPTLIRIVEQAGPQIIQVESYWYQYVSRKILVNSETDQLLKLSI